MKVNPRFDGTAARQLTLEDDTHTPLVAPLSPSEHDRRPLSLRLLQRDVYADLARRRRRAQIAARHLVASDLLGRDKV